ncbi:hypothetical protein BD779DRAFT_1491665 [Infundibulicybe gibba]|nr:hypothetical protein BD779DRAFT_1491665 [Infundibulicybe gibba]
MVPAPSSPKTPPPGLRNRHMAGEFVSSSSVSPTSTLSDSALASAAGPIRLNDVGRPSLRNVIAASNGPLRAKPTVRADLSMLTCFDPADEELYALWAPKLKT